MRVGIRPECTDCPNPADILTSRGRRGPKVYLCFKCQAKLKKPSKVQLPWSADLAEWDRVQFAARQRDREAQAKERALNFPRRAVADIAAVPQGRHAVTVNPERTLTHDLALQYKSTKGRDDQ